MRTELVQSLSELGKLQHPGMTLNDLLIMKYGFLTLLTYAEMLKAVTCTADKLFTLNKSSS